MTPVSFRFRCEVCSCPPDGATRSAIDASTKENLFGALIEAMPGKWLVWHAGGLLGPRRCACPDHREELLQSIRHHYGSTGGQWVWKRPPFPQRWPPDGIIEAPDGTLTLPDWFGADPGPDEPPPAGPGPSDPETP
jgi:hypothetical protein